MRIILSLLLFLCLSLTVHADVITHDPNTPEAQQETAVTQTTDPRLAQKITCTLGYTRLHTVVEELSRLSGVSIRCGKHNDDWYVRDIPVVVWIKDLSLGKVLETLAAATHTQLTSSKLDNIITYRIVKSSRLDRQIADYEQDKQKAVIEALMWDWDTAVKMKDLPDSAFAPGKDAQSQLGFSLACAPESLSYIRAAGALLVELGPEIRDQIIHMSTSYSIEWDDATPALRTALLDMGRATIEQQKALMARQSKANFDASRLPNPELSQVSVSLSCLRSEVYGSRLNIGVTVQIAADFSSPYYGNDLSGYTSLLAKYANGTGLGERPASPVPPVDDLPSGYTQLAKTGDGNDPLLFKSMVNLTAPVDKENLITSDALIELAKATGLSIISEDFQSHLDAGNPALMFGKERSIADVLRRFNQLSTTADGTPFGGRDWFVDEKINLVLGQSMDWVRQHRDLVPEKLIVNIRDKMNSTGVMLDDIIPVACLTEGQRREWITMSPEFSPLKTVFVNKFNTDLLALYTKLDKERKAFLLSENGLPANILDTNEAAPLFNELRRVGESFKADKQSDPYFSLYNDDPESLKYFSLHLRRQAYTGRYTGSLKAKLTSDGHAAIDISGAELTVNGHTMILDSSTNALNEISSLVDLHTWNVSMHYNKGDLHHIWGGDIGPYPVFSPKRLAELKEQAKKAQPK